MEACSHGLSNTWTLSPCFRAELSHGNRHVAEFYMLEAEYPTKCLSDLLDHVESLIRKNYEDIITNEDIMKQLSNFWKYVVKDKKYFENNIKPVFSTQFVRITYDNAINILKLQSGDDIDRTSEKKLSKHFKNKGIFITHFPTTMKAFYMKTTKTDESLTESFDLIFPVVGELVGGSLREDDYNKLQSKIPSEKMKNFDWYLDLRKSGSVSTGGYGLGFDRWLMFLTGAENIKEIVPFPRQHGTCLT